MQKEQIKFKANTQGIQLFIEDGLSFEEAFKQIHKKMEDSRGYFSEDESIMLLFQGLNWSKEDIALLGKMLLKYKLYLKVMDIMPFPDFVRTKEQKEIENQENTFTNNKIVLSQEEKELLAGEHAIVLYKTLRSGVKVESDNSVVILGDVNPGAEIIAGGNILVFGNMAGFAHAGAFGNRKAFILAHKLTPIQVRIGDLIARYSQNELPDLRKNILIQGEMAFVENERVLIKIMEKKQLR